jgi:hypothetical protein
MSTGNGVVKSPIRGSELDFGLDDDGKVRGEAITLLPLSHPPFILGPRSTLSIWLAAVALSRSLYS